MLSSTPSSHGSTTVPTIDFSVRDPTFNSEEYELEEMRRSPPKVAELSATQEIRKISQLAQTLALAKCLIDIGEDLIVGNNQRKQGFWTCIGQRYNQAGVNPDGAPTHSSSELRKHFECVKYDMSWYLREQHLNHGEGYELRRRPGVVYRQFTGTVNSVGFNHCEACTKLKDHPKFQVGIVAAMVQGSGRTRLVGSQSLSSGGPAPTTLFE